MPSSRKLPALIVCAALGLSAAAAEKKEKPKTEPKAASTTKKKSADDKKSDEKKPDAPFSNDAPKPQGKLSLPLPKGQDSKGIVIPYTDGTGKKSMVFRIGVGRRLDDENVNMNDLLIETYDEKGVQEMTIELPASHMNLSTRTIVGNETVTVKRSDFQLTGQTMEFNTETKQGWVKGNVKMIIYDLSDETGNTPTKGERKTEEQGS